jgi:hypothetical protein
MSCKRVVTAAPPELAFLTFCYTKHITAYFDCFHVLRVTCNKLIQNGREPSILGQCLMSNLGFAREAVAM